MNAETLNDSARCDMEPLVHADLDGRIGEKDSASLTRHLEACASCAQLQSELNELRALGKASAPLTPRTELEHRRQRLAIMREAARPTQNKSSGGVSRLFPLAAAAALVVVALAGAERLTSSNEDAAPSAMHQPTAVEGPTPKAPSEKGPTTDALVESPYELAGTVTLADGASAEHSWKREGTGVLERVDLRDGRVDVKVDHLREGQRFVVFTPDAEVEVRGTAFSVEVGAGVLRRVTVTEGLVEVRHGQSMSLLHAGDSWPPPQAVAVAPDAAVPSDSGPTEMATASKPSSAAAPSQSDRPEQKGPSFADAIAELEAGNYAGASERLSAFANDNPDDPLAEDAAFLRIIAEQRAGNVNGAKAAAKAYLATYPNGARRDEAKAILND